MCLRGSEPHVKWLSRKSATVVRCFAHSADSKRCWRKVQLRLRSPNGKLIRRVTDGCKIYIIFFCQIKFSVNLEIFKLVLEGAAIRSINPGLLFGLDYRSHSTQSNKVLFAHRTAVWPDFLTERDERTFYFSNGLGSNERRQSVQTQMRHQESTTVSATSPNHVERGFSFRSSFQLF